MLQYKKGKERQGEPMTEDKGVQSIDRALDIIEAVAEAGRPMGLTEIAIRPACIRAQLIASSRRCFSGATSPRQMRAAIRSG